MSLDIFQIEVDDLTIKRETDKFIDPDNDLLGAAMMDSDRSPT